MPVGAGILFAGWAMSRVVHFSAGEGHRLPITLRLALAGSLLTWMLGGLGLQWFSRGALSGRRVVRSATGIVPIAAVGLLVSDPILLLALAAAIITGYAFAITTEIWRVRAEVGGRPDY